MIRIAAIFFLLLSTGLRTNEHRMDDRDPINPGLKEVLLLGDSVMAGIGRSGQGKQYLARHHSYIFGAVDGGVSGSAVQ